MILRVFEAQLMPGAEDAFETALRDDIAAAQAQPGLISIRWGRRAVDGSCQVLVVSEWGDLDSVRRWLGPGYLAPRFAPGEAALVRNAHVVHYEGLEA